VGTVLTVLVAEDILKARIKTLGVTEYRFSMTSTSNALSHDWRLFDVGGQRSLVSSFLAQLLLLLSLTAFIARCVCGVGVVLVARR
jgi:hypothetical protein